MADPFLNYNSLLIFITILIDIYKPELVRSVYGFPIGYRTNKARGRSIEDSRKNLQYKNIF